MSQAVHAALANVIQDPLSTAAGESCLSNHASLAAGDSTASASNHCQNCSKLRQQLTLLIYEVLNLENTMESKICEYVQRRLNDIAVSEQLTATKSHTTEPAKSAAPLDFAAANSDSVGNVTVAAHASPRPSVDLSSNSSTCNYSMAQNNNHMMLDGTHSSERANKSLDSLSGPLKYRAERTLTFENVLIGDSALKYLDPARFDVERKTYIKTMVHEFARTFEETSAVCSV